MDYLDWRGDLSFDDSPFNEVDNYIISKIGTLDFSGIVSADTETIVLNEALERYLSLYGEKGYYLGLLSSDQIVPAVEKMSKTRRFQDLQLSGFVQRIDPAATEQFSAMTVAMPDGRHYISFRGTDDTLMAWKENLLMSLESAVAAQIDALNYLLWAASVYPGELLIGGHSKGGNLAIYASASAPPDIQDRISQIFSNDGPGFPASFLEQRGYLRIRPKIRILLPQYSFIGTLLTQEENIEIIRSSKSGFSAHDGFTWEVKGPRFERCDRLSKSSQAFDETMDKMMDKMSLDDRKAFIEELFGVLTATGAVTLTDLTDTRLRQAIVLAKSVYDAPEVKKFLFGTLENMLREYIQ